MSSSVNKIMIVGNLGADPEIRKTSTGSKIAHISVATSDRWKDQDGNPVEKTEWHKVVIFGPSAEIAEQYLQKGSLVHVEGSIRSNKWTDNDGNERNSVEVHITQGNGGFTMLGSRPGHTPGPGPDPAPPDDDIPF